MFTLHESTTLPITFRLILIRWVVVNLTQIILFQVNSRIKALKRQLDETEEEVSREKAQRRKIQRELEDLIQDNEAKDREITNLKNKLR